MGHRIAVPSGKCDEVGLRTTPPLGPRVLAFGDAPSKLGPIPTPNAWMNANPAQNRLRRRMALRKPCASATHSVLFPLPPRPRNDRLPQLCRYESNRNAIVWPNGISPQSVERKHTALPTFIISLRHGHLSVVVRVSAHGTPHPAAKRGTGTFPS